MFVMHIKKLCLLKIEFVNCDIESYQTKGELFDYITLGGVLEHIINPTSIMKTICYF